MRLASFHIWRQFFFSSHIHENELKCQKTQTHEKTAQEKMLAMAQ